MAVSFPEMRKSEEKQLDEEVKSSVLDMFSCPLDIQVAIQVEMSCQWSLSFKRKASSDLEVIGLEIYLKP